jgi:hypothetical protein
VAIVLDAVTRFAAGEGNLKALDPNWDNTFVDKLAAGDFGPPLMRTPTSRSRTWRPVGSADPQLDGAGRS